MAEASRLPSIEPEVEVRALYGAETRTRVGSSAEAGEQDGECRRAGRHV